MRSQPSSNGTNHEQTLDIARAFVQARSSATPLARYPGSLPTDLAAAYRIQDQAIKLWPDRIAGWKVGLIPGELAQQYGATRLTGPVFGQSVQQAASGQPVEFAIVDGGFGAIEVEVVFLLGADAPPDKLEWTTAEAVELVSQAHVGIEIAGSPYSGINHHGPCVVVSDFGNNTGLIIGQPIAGWRDRLAESWVCEAWIDGREVGQRDFVSLDGAALESLRFLLELTAVRGLSLKKGQYITSGAITGVHAIRPGQTARALFGSQEVIDCRAVAATEVP